jgi:hypothetical protein
VDFVVCTLAVKKKIRAGFNMSYRTIPLLDREHLDRTVYIWDWAYSLQNLGGDDK